MPLFLIIFCLSTFFTKPVLAVTATPSAEKTQDIVNLVQQKVKEKLNLITTPSTQPKSFFGNITQITDDQISISYQNKTQNINIGDSTVYVDTKKNKSKLANFKVGQTILAMGYLNETNNLDAKRIVLLDLKSIENNNQTVTGQIVDISKSSPIIVIIPTKDKNNQYQIKTDSKTEIISLDGKKISSSSLSSGKKVIVIIQPDAKIAKTFYAIKIISLESASISPTPTIKP
jgi:hypothetical protein